MRNHLFSLFLSRDRYYLRKASQRGHGRRVSELQIVASGVTVDIERFADDTDIRSIELARFHQPHCFQIDLIEGDSACSDHGVVPAAGAADGIFVRGQLRGKDADIFIAELAEFFDSALAVPAPSPAGAKTEHSFAAKAFGSPNCAAM